MVKRLSKVAVLQMLSRQTHNITHSLTASVIHVNAILLLLGAWTTLIYEISIGLPRTIVLLFKRFTIIAGQL